MLVNYDLEVFPFFIVWHRYGTIDLYQFVDNT